MDPVKSSSASRQSKFQAGSFIEYFEALKQEFQKIEWTGKSEVKTYTKVVVISIFVFGMLIYATDLVIRAVLSGLDVIFRSIFG